MVSAAALARTVVVCVASAGLVYSATQVDVRADWSRAGDDRASRSLSAAMSTTVVCPGPDRPGTPAYERALQTVTVTTSAAPAALLDETAAGGSMQTTRLPESAGGAPPRLSARPATAGAPLTGAGSVRIVGQGGLATGLAALQHSVEQEKTVGGLAATACSQPVADAWIPLGGNQSGRVSRVVLSNPGSSAVTADVAVIGSKGRVAGKGAAGVVVPPSDRVVVNIGDFDADLANAMVHVTSRGGAVSVSGNDVLMTGETRAGVASAAPIQASTDQVLPVVPVQAGRAGVRVAVPGAATTVRVRAIDATGLVVTDEVVDLPGGVTSAVALQGISRGSYAVRVTAEQPVVAAAQTDAATQGPSDISWSTATPAVPALTGSPVPSVSGVRTWLAIFAPDKAATVDVVTIGPGGGNRRLAVAADTPTWVEVTGRDAVWVRVRSGSVHAALSSAGTQGAQPLLEVAGLEPVLVKPAVRDTSAERD